MRVIQINAVYKYSSTGRSTYEMHKEFQKRNIDSYVFWGTINRCDEKDLKVNRIGNDIDHKIHALVTKLLGEHGRGSVLATYKLCKKIKDIAPDVVHLRNLHSNYINFSILIKFLSKNNIPALISLHDCWIYTGGCMFYTEYGCEKWKTGCEKCDNKYGKLVSTEKQLRRKNKLISQTKVFGIIGVSKWVANEAKKSVLSEHTYIDYIYNWMDLSQFCRVNTEQFRIENGLIEKKIALSVSNSWIPDSKGAKDLITLAMLLPDVTFIIIGNGLGNFSFPENVRCVGHTDSVEELVRYYSVADVFVNPSRQETFGKVTAEALCCGTPIAAYNNTATTELVNEHCGVLCCTGNVYELKKAIQLILVNGKENYSDSCRKFAEENFSINHAAEKHINVYKKLIRMNNDDNK